MISKIPKIISEQWIAFRKCELLSQQSCNARHSLSHDRHFPYKMTDSGFPRNPGKFIHHPNLKPDRSDALSPYIKSLIVDNSPARHLDYIPEKVIIRTDGNYLARDSKAIASERINRMMVSAMSPKSLSLDGPKMWIRIRSQRIVSTIGYIFFRTIWSIQGNLLWMHTSSFTLHYALILKNLKPQISFKSAIQVKMSIL